MTSSARVTRNSRFAIPGCAISGRTRRRSGGRGPWCREEGGIRASAHQLQAFLEWDLSGDNLVRCSQTVEHGRRDNFTTANVRKPPCPQPPILHRAESGDIDLLTLHRAANLLDLFLMVRVVALGHSGNQRRVSRGHFSLQSPSQCGVLIVAQRATRWPRRVSL